MKILTCDEWTEEKLFQKRLQRLRGDYSFLKRFIDAKLYKDGPERDKNGEIKRKPFRIIPGGKK